MTFALTKNHLAAWLAGTIALTLSACGTATPPRVEDPQALTGSVTATVEDTAVHAVSEHPQPRLPATVTDVQGTEVVVDDVSRILALDLYGTTSRIVFELGLGDNVVGRDSSSTFKEIEDRTLVTPAGHELNAEAILQLAPTLIITDTSLGPWAVIEQMRDAGVSVVVVDSERSMANVADLTRQVGAAVGLADEAEQLAERTQTQIDEAIAEIAEVAPSDDAKKLRIAFLYLRGQSGVYYLFGDGSGSDSLIESLGAVDVASEVGVTGMKPMTDEALVAAGPDVVLCMTKGLESVGGVDGLIDAVPAFSQTPAGANHRVVDMADSDILSFGSTTPQVLRSLASALYGVSL